MFSVVRFGGEEGEGRFLKFLHMKCDQNVKNAVSTSILSTVIYFDETHYSVNISRKLLL